MSDEHCIEAILGRGGQLTLPKKLQEASNLLEGSRVELRVRNGEVVITPVRGGSHVLDKWFGKYPQESTTDDAIAYTRELRGWEESEIDL